MTPEQLQLRDEVREMARSVSREYILDMDADKIKYPKEYMRECGKRNLIGIRVPKKYGGRGGLWVDDIIAAEEICVNGPDPPAAARRLEPLLIISKQLASRLPIPH